MTLNIRRVKKSDIENLLPLYDDLYSMKIKKQTRKQAAGSTGVRQGDADEV